MIKFTHMACLFLLLGIGHSVQAGGLASEVVEAAARFGLKESLERSAGNAAKSTTRKAMQTAGREATESSTKSLGERAIPQTMNNVLGSSSKATTVTGFAATELSKSVGAANSVLSPQHARRLSMLLPDLEASGKATKVLELVAKQGAGDQVVDFLWRNKATLAGGVAITALLANPEKVIAAGTSVAQTGIQTAGDSIVKPITTANPSLAMAIAMIALLALAISFTTRFRTWISLTWYLFKPIRKHN